MSKRVWMSWCLEMTHSCTSEGSPQWLRHTLFSSSVHLCRIRSFSVLAQLGSLAPASDWEGKTQVSFHLTPSTAYSTPIFKGSASGLELSTEWSGGCHLLHSQARGGDISFDIMTSLFKKGIGKANSSIFLVPVSPLEHIEWSGH